MKSLVVDSPSGSSAGSDQDLSARSSWFDTAKFVLNTVNHIFIGFVFIYTVWICWKYGLEKIFAWHVLLCMTGVSVAGLFRLG